MTNSRNDILSALHAIGESAPVQAKIEPWTPPQVSDFDVEGHECIPCINADMMGKPLPHIHHWDEESQTEHVIDNLEAN